MSFLRMSKDGVDALIVQPSLQTKRAAELALTTNLPAASPIESFTEDGGLISYAAVLRINTGWPLLMLTRS